MLKLFRKLQAKRRRRKLAIQVRKERGRAIAERLFSKFPDYTPPR